MDAYPIDLVLAVAAASATVFLGFLPVKNIRSGFFAREAFKATAAWIVVAAISPLSVMHYPFILAVLCFVAWWNFQRDDAFTGKIWLSLAAGLGISVGVMVILAVTPGCLPTRAFVTMDASAPPPPQGLDLAQAGCLASLYLGGAVVGLAYVGYVLCREGATRPGLSGFVQNCVGLLFNLTLLRAVVLLIEMVTNPVEPDKYEAGVRRLNFMLSPIDAEDALQSGIFLIAVLALVIFVLAYLARRAARFSSRLQPTRLLAAIILVGLVTEILARIELL